MGVIGQTIYQCRNQCSILEHLRPFGKFKIDLIMVIIRSERSAMTLTWNEIEAIGHKTL